MSGLWLLVPCVRVGSLSYDQALGEARGVVPTEEAPVSTTLAEELRPRPCAGCATGAAVLPGLVAVVVVAPLVRLLPTRVVVEPPEPLLSEGVGTIDGVVRCSDVPAAGVAEPPP
jgi:hypothetical protein